ncbi:MAG: GNAT family N-acetyltransferase [Actinomycetales bacterium]|nr:GNAT family N-acetyltransferase [Actinomycetales bacterium]
MTSHAGHTHHPTADVSVRPSLVDDAAEIGRIQVAAWRGVHRGTVPDEVLEGLDAATFARAWRGAISQPPSAKHRMLTACAGPFVVGFAALAPASDAEATGEIVELDVDPDHLREGHASRLLAACVDILRETGASQVRTWVLEGDGAREAFLASAGLGPAGVRRTLEVDGTQVDELAWTGTL